MEKSLPAGIRRFAPRDGSGGPENASAPVARHPTGTIDSIQYLRAIAAWLVVVYHLSASLGSQFGWDHGFALGAIGVDIFFVISGYIMAMIAARSSHFSPLEFLLRRAARIAPLYWLMTFAFCLVCVLYPSVVNNPDVTWSRMLFSLFFLPDIIVGTTLPALMVGWTLNYEFFFYTVVAFSIWLSQDRTLRVASLILCGCAAAGIFIDGNSIFEFYTQPIIMEFVLGILIWNHGAQLAHKPWFLPVLLLCLPAMFVALAVSGIYNDEIRFMIWGIPSALLVAGAIPFFSLQLPWLSRLGDWSFSTYLLHVYVIQLFVKVLAEESIDNSSLLAVQVLLALGIIVVISAIQFTCFERPAAKTLNRWLDTRWPKDGRLP